MHRITRLDPGICRQAIDSRDPRFDGRFFAGAVTTGLYCRNICPMQFAEPANLVLFQHAAAAEAAGFRPCKRCRPQAAPGTPAWLGTSAVVSRGLRLILEGALNEGSVEQLAAKLGLGSRQLRRLFVQHLGAPPLRIASTQRVHIARKLIHESSLRVGEVAFCSGFRSIREFNHAVRLSTGRTPGELRRAAGPAIIAGQRPGLELHLRFRKPFDWDGLIAFFKPRAIPGVEVVADRAYQRTIEIGGAPGFLTARPDDAGSRMVVHLEMNNYGMLPQAVERIRRLFDLDADPVKIARHLSGDAALRPLVDLRPGLRIPGAWDRFEAVVLAVLGQSIASVGPKKMIARLVRLFGKPVESPVRGIGYLFPGPEVLATAELSKAGVGEASIRTLRKLAHAAISGRLEQAVSKTWMTFGIDESTANYIALRAWGEPDAFPLQSVERAEGCRPWRAYAAMHMADR